MKMHCFCTLSSFAIFVNVFHSKHILNCSHSCPLLGWLKVLVTKISACWKEHKSIGYGLNHKLPVEIISHQTDSSTLIHTAIRSWTQLLIAGRLNLVCHQIPVGGRDEDIVQRATRPVHREALTPTDTSSRKFHQQFPLKLEVSCLSVPTPLLGSQRKTIM